MIDYFAMLSNLDFPKTPHSATVKTAKRSYDSFGSDHKGHILEIEDPTETNNNPPDFPKVSLSSTALTALTPFGSKDSEPREHISETKPLIEPIEEPNNEVQPTADLWVLRWTPSGAPLAIKVKSQEDAERIVRLNPKPAKVQDTEPHRIDATKL